MTASESEAALTAKPVVRQYAWARSLGFSLFLLATAFVAARVASAFIDARYPNRPLPPDLLFDALPRIPWTQYLTDIALLVQLGLLVWYLSRGRWHRLPEMIALFSIMELMRAAFIVLTPLAGPLGNGAFYGIIRVTQNGEFPSGHVASALLFFLFVDATEEPLLSKVMLALVFVECGSLLLSRGHYSIDIVGGLLLSYFIWHEYKEGTLFNWLKPLITP